MSESQNIEYKETIPKFQNVISNAINMFYKQIILQRGLPFDVKLPSLRQAGLYEMSDAELNEELEKGYADMLAGRTKPVKTAFSDIRRIIIYDLSY